MEIIAACGLLCNECSAYQATVNNDDLLRQQTAAEWTQTYKHQFKPEDINCLGCHSDIRFSHCRVCEIRKCNIEKSISNCAGCDSFGCEQLTGFWQYVPEAKERLEKIRG